MRAAESLDEIGFIVWDAAEPVLSVSEVARSLLALDAQADIALPHLLDLLDGQEEAELRSLWRDAVARRAPTLSGSYVLRLGQRAPRRFDAHLLINYTDDGRVGSCVAAVQDVTRQTETLEALRKSEARLEEAQNIANFGWWEWNFETRQATFSDKALEMFGRPKGWNPDMQALQELVPEDQRQWVVGLYADAMATHQPRLRYEVKYQNASGELHEVHQLVKIDYASSGKPHRLIATMQDISELKSYRKQLHELSFYDPTTRLPNRALFMDRLTQALSDASWHNQQVGLMMLDLDRFKDINDSMGHGWGDSLLQQAAQRLQQVLRGYDTVARLGGDEFAVVLPEVRHATDLGSIAKKVLSAFNKPFMLERQEVFVTASIGGAIFPDDARDVDQLMQHADAALYSAKSKGRNNFQFYSRDLTAQATERLTIESELRKAITNGELELYYQPKFELMGSKLVGAEALMRWNHPQRGMVPPLSFISIAEDTGLIVPMGQWALETACRAAAQWNASRAQPLKIAVNLSVRQFATGDFAQVVRETLQRTGCDPRWLELEITESLLLDGQKEVLGILEDISSLGISIAIDDFGTGYSALSYLTRFPVQVLKIDRSFIKDLPGDRSSTELVKAIVSLGHSLSMSLVAEGVETPEQAGHLQGLGCELVQGYLFGKPVPHAAFTQLATPRVEQALHIA